MPDLYDAHCHLQDERLADLIDEVFEDYSSDRVSGVVVNGTRPEDWERVARLADERSIVVPSFGLHPWYIKKATERWREELEAYIKAYPNSGLGEIGLDRWIEGCDIDAQSEAFVWQWELAAELNRPITVHCLKGWGLLQDCLSKAERPDRGFLLHSYGGSREMIPVFAKLGAYFSISGYFALERKRSRREVLKSIPIDRLLIETDAPDMLGPDEIVRRKVVDEKGKAFNHPLNLSGVYQFVSELREIEMDELRQIVEENWIRLFRDR